MGQTYCENKMMLFFALHCTCTFNPCWIC